MLPPPRLLNSPFSTIRNMRVLKYSEPGQTLKSPHGFVILFITVTAFLPQSLHFLGFGVFTTANVEAGEFLLEYRGELVSSDEGNRRRKQYHPNLGSYLFFYNKFWYVFHPQCIYHHHPPPPPPPEGGGGIFYRRPKGGSWVLIF